MTLATREGEVFFFFVDGLLEEDFGGLGEGEVGRGRVEDVFIDLRPLIV